MRSECGARARSRKPLPGGSGPPLGRHDDRSPRSSVDSRQATAGNTRRAGSQETRELELSQRRMRSPWRVPRRSAERRAARDRAAAAQRSNGNIRSCDADTDGAPIGAPPPFGGGNLSVRVVVRKARMPRRIARMICFIRPRTKCGGGGPPEGWWRGQAPTLAARPKPLPPRLRAVPPPRCAGRDEDAGVRKNEIGRDQDAQDSPKAFLVA